MPLSGYSFRQPGFYVLLVKKDLPLQVVIFDEIPIYDSDFAHPGPHQQSGDISAECATADYDHIPLAQLYLSFFADGREHRLS